MISKKITLPTLILLYGILVFFAFRSTTSRFGYFNYQSTLWADRAGYYVYLPSAFIYGFKASEFPQDIEPKTGYGFTLDKAKNKVLTKYTYGVALLNLPFFIVAHTYSSVKGTADGFGPAYHKVVNMAAPFYTLLGLFLLFLFLKDRINKKVALISTALIFAGTNLYYYTIYDAGMSHAYSFFLFSLLIYASHRYKTSGFITKWLGLAAFAISFIVLIRPTDGIIALIIPFFASENSNEIKTFIASLFTAQKIILSLAIFASVFVPQLVYWKYSTGNWLTYSYQNEGFDFISSPRIIEVLFSTNNGLFLYNPIYILLFAALINTIIKKPLTGIPVSVLIVFSIYIIASWHCWYYGCSFGLRPFVQYSAFLALPFAFMVKEIIPKTALLSLVVIAGIVFSLFSIRVSHAFDRCFFGSTWDFREYSKYISALGIMPRDNNTMYWFDDYENDNLPKTGDTRKRLKVDFAKSGAMVAYADSISPYSAGFSEMFENIINAQTKRVEISVYTYCEKPAKDILLSCEISSPDSNFFWKSFEIINNGDKTWQQSSYTLNLPDTIGHGRLKVYIWSTSGIRIYSDNLRIRFSR
jgi:hypothetical protein